MMIVYFQFQQINLSPPFLPFFQFGRTPLMFAVLGDYPDCVEVLLKHGARSGARDSSGRTALHWAAHHGNVQCLKVRSEAGFRKKIV